MSPKRRLTGESSKSKDPYGFAASSIGDGRRGGKRKYKNPTKKRRGEKKREREVNAFEPGEN